MYLRRLSSQSKCSRLPIRTGQLSWKWIKSIANGALRCELQLVMGQRRQRLNREILAIHRKVRSAENVTRSPDRVTLSQVFSKILVEQSCKKTQNFHVRRSLRVLRRSPENISTHFQLL